jgi:hypothetical protein
MKKESLRVLNEREKDVLRAVLIDLLPSVEKVVAKFNLALNLNKHLDMVRDEVNPPTKRKK